MNPINQLAELFSHFPGIGPRQAKRFVYYLLTRPKGQLDELSRLVSELKNSVTECTECHRYYQKDRTASLLCTICRDTSRNEAVRVIVSRDVDIDVIERTGTFTGKYFVLGGSIPILEKNPQERVRLIPLRTLAEEKGKTGILKELILALNANPEGEHTGDVVESFIKPTTDTYGIKISHLGRGISTGTEIEYSDSETLKNAFNNRY